MKSSLAVLERGPAHALVSHADRPGFEDVHLHEQAGRRK